MDDDSFGDVPGRWSRPFARKYTPIRPAIYFAVQAIANMPKLSTDTNLNVRRTGEFPFLGATGAARHQPDGIDDRRAVDRHGFGRAGLSGHDAAPAAGAPHRGRRVAGVFRINVCVVAGVGPLRAGGSIFLASSNRAPGWPY